MGRLTLGSKVSNNTGCDSEDNAGPWWKVSGGGSSSNESRDDT